MAKSSLILPRRFYSQPQGYPKPADDSIISLLLPAGGSMIECAAAKPSSIATFGTPPSGSAGKFGRAILCADGGLILNNTAAYSTNAYTVTFAVNVTAFDVWGGLFAVSNSDGTGRFSLQRVEATPELRVYHNDRNYVTIAGVSTTDFTAGGDLIFTVSFSGTAVGSLKMYLNGVLRFSNTHDFVPAAPSSPRLVLFGERTASNLYSVDGKVYFGCLHNRQLADAEVFSLHANPWQLFRAKPRVLYFDVAAGGGAITAALNPSAETDTAQAIAVSPIHRLLGQVVETDTAQAVARIKLKAIDQSMETGTAQAVSSRKVLAVGQASETDAAQAITEAGAVTAPVGQVAEADSAQAVASRKIKTIGQASEASSAQAITVAKAVAVAQATETDSAQAISADTTKVVAAGRAQETDAAAALSSRKALAVGLVAETEFAQAIAHYKAAGVLQAVESDSAHSITLAGIRAVGMAAESEIAMSITAIGGSVVSPKAALTAAGSKAGLTRVGAYADLTQTTQF